MFNDYISREDNIFWVAFMHLSKKTKLTPMAKDILFHLLELDIIHNIAIDISYMRDYLNFDIFGRSIERAFKLLSEINIIEVKGKGSSRVITKTPYLQHFINQLKVNI